MEVYMDLLSDIETAFNVSFITNCYGCGEAISDGGMVIVNKSGYCKKCAAKIKEEVKNDTR
jgi:hypothetical protein